MFQESSQSADKMFNLMKSSNSNKRRQYIKTQRDIPYMQN